MDTTQFIFKSGEKEEIIGSTPLAEFVSAIVPLMTRRSRKSFGDKAVPIVLEIQKARTTASEEDVQQALQLAERIAETIHLNRSLPEKDRPSLIQKLLSKNE